MAETWAKRWQSVWTSDRLKTGWLVAAGVVALYFGAIRPYQVQQGINNSRTAGVAESPAMWRRSGYMSREHVDRRHEPAGIVAGVPGGITPNKSAPRMMAYLNAPMSVQSQPESDSSDPSADRKVVRTSSIELVVRKPGESAEQIRTLAERMGGFLVSSEVRGDSDMSGGSLTVRVPAARFEEARAEIRKLALRVESEKIEAEDVTRQYVDQESNLRNLKAEEAQYLTILKQARTVKDTLDVSEKLSDVRGQIDQQQAEFNALSKQIETVAISVTLRTEADTRVLGLNWRPLYQFKIAVRDGLDGLANYVSAMIAFVFFLPTIVLWLATIVIACALGWRLLRWIGHRWFGWKPRVPVQA